MSLDFFARFNENVRRTPDRIAFQYLDGAQRETFTYQQVQQRAAAIGSRLAAEGLRPGDHAGILIETHPLWGLAFLGAQSAGAVIVPLDPLHDSETLASLIAHSECRWTLVSEPLMPKLKQAEALLGCRLTRLVLSRTEERREDAPLPLVSRSPDDELMILYTSGTTGAPKGAILTGRNVYQNVAAGIAMVGPTSEEHFLNVLPLNHVLALVINFIIPLYLGARVTFLATLEAQAVLQAFRQEGISLFICVPQFYYLMHRRILQQVQRQPALKRFLFRRLLSLSRFCNLRLGFNPGRLFFPAIHRPFGPRMRLFGVGGARFDPQVAESLRDMGFSIVQAFGMTETAALATLALPKGRAVGTVGVPLPHVQIRIHQPDETGCGELLIRGENVMRGYYRNPEATAQALRDGWLHTGDLGRIDRYGFLRITGRSKDVIALSSGKNVHPEEVERFYQAGCANIKEICVVGVPDNGGERLHAVVVPDFDVLKQKGIVNAYDAIRWEMESLSQKLPGYQRVLSLEIRQEPLPRTTTRKLKRFEITRQVREGTRPPQSAEQDYQPQNPVEHLVFHLIRAIKDIASICPTMNLELELGLSSLERVELVSSIEQASGARIPPEVASRFHTVAELISAVEAHTGSVAEAPAEGRVDWGSLLSAPLSPAERLLAARLLCPAPFREAIRYGLALLVRAAARLLLRLRWQGLGNLPGGPFLICPNHSSYIDVFVVMCVLPWRVSRRVFFLGDATLFRGRFMEFAAYLLRVITVSPDQAVHSALRLAAEGLRRGFVLCVFPEGERSIDGKLKVFRKGPAIVATELGVPAAPVAIQGAWEVWPRGSNRIRLHPVRVSFGEPLQATGKTADSFNAELRQAVERML
ncbi:MAG: AMP-binding protein [Bryobacteraceae bacterium]